MEEAKLESWTKLDIHKLGWMSTVAALPLFALMNQVGDRSCWGLVKFPSGSLLTAAVFELLGWFSISAF